MAILTSGTSGNASALRPGRGKGIARNDGVSCMVLAVVVWTGWMGAVAGYADSPSYTEYQVKAAFLCRFAMFVDWPDDALPGADSPFLIGVLGVDPFKSVLDETIKGKMVKERELQVRRSRKAADLEGCHIVFICSSEKERLKEALAVFGDRSTLTVGEMEGFAQRGGIIRLTKEKDKIRFEVNIDAAKKARLKISSRLLKLAKIVRNRDNGEG